ncbi:MAG: hypothetical protein K0S12_498 [Bacteroidetes bacterium]|jgi:hypothetical protein|nr:hypothetical protein [Bacteroidota bacterium]
MKTILLGLFITCISITKAQSWQWAKSLGYSETEYSSAHMAQNTNGDILISFLKNYPQLKTDLILCNVLGDTIWKKEIPDLQITELFFDQGNICFCGIFKNSLVLGNSTFTSAGGNDAIAGRMDYNLNLIQHKIIATESHESFGSFIRKDNHYYLTGSFRKTFTDGAFTFTTNNLSDCFVMKTDLNFNVLKKFQTTEKYPQGGEAAGVRIRTDDGNNNVYLLGFADMFVNFDTTQIHFYEGNFLVRFNSDLQMNWVKKLSHGGAGDSYNPQLEMDHQNNPSLIFRPGGGGGNIHQVSLRKFSPSGNMICNKLLPMVYFGHLRKDEKENLWVAGYYGEFVPPVYFSVVKIDTAGVTHAVIYDSVPNVMPAAFHVKKEYDFYVIANFKDTVQFTGFTYTSQGSRFLIHYGEQEIVSVQETTAGKAPYSVYPNPASGSLFIHGKDLKEIRMYNALGQVCLTRKITLETCELDVQALNPGVYFIKINNSELRKVIIR